MANRITAPERQEGDLTGRTLRPQSLAEFVGQNAIRERLQVYIQAARARGEPLDHVLLLSPPGLGKTTLAYIIAREMGSEIKVSSGPAIERPGDLAAILTHLAPGDVLFLDEIHRLRPPVEEVLYPAMEDYKLDIVVGEGPHARSIRLDLAPFTLVGPRRGRASSPLRYGTGSRSCSASTSTPRRSWRRSSPVLRPASGARWTAMRPGSWRCGRGGRRGSRSGSSAGRATWPR